MNEFLQSSSGSRLVRLLSMVFAIVVLYMIALTINEFRTGSYIGREGGMQSTITVTGDGEVFQAPDIATFSFTVTEESKTVADAQKKATDKLNKAVEMLKKSGVNNEKDVRTLEYRINPKYEYYYQPQPMACASSYCPPVTVKEPKIIGYEVSQTTEVKVRKLEGAGELLTGVGDLGVQFVGNLQFKIENEDGVKQEAQKLAITEAREKAEKLADQLGVSLVRVSNFSETSYAPYFYGRGGDAYSTVSAKVESAPEISAGENKISSNVTITYEIR